MSNSWLHLPYQDPQFSLEKDLALLDEFHARDCGWVEQMRPFIREFSLPGEVVLDPFAGFASTLIAAHLEGRRAVGIEIEEHRFHIAHKRLANLGVNTLGLLNGNCHQLVHNLDPVDLLITNMPYFGSGFTSSQSSQVYTASYYGDYLYRIRESLKQFKSALKPSAYIICMVQNVYIAEQFIPQAWDIAKLLSEQFRFIEERVIVYDRPVADSDQRPNNRAHEYVLIAQHLPQAIDIHLTLEVARELQGQVPGAIVFGGMANWLHGAAVQPSDLDIFLPFDLAAIQHLIAWLIQQGFDITRWGKPCSYASISMLVSDSQYLRAERLSADGRLVLIDITFAEDASHYHQLTQSRQLIQGINCSRHVIVFND